MSATWGWAAYGCCMAVAWAILLADSAVADAIDRNPIMQRVFFPAWNRIMRIANRLMRNPQ